MASQKLSAFPDRNLPAGPVVDAFAITAGQTLQEDVRAIYVGVTGNITVTTWKGTTIQFKNVPVGVLPIACTAVTAATASELIGLV